MLSDQDVVAESLWRPLVESLRAQFLWNEGGGGGSWCVETGSKASAIAILTKKRETKSDDEDEVKIMFLVNVFLWMNLRSFNFWNNY